MPDKTKIEWCDATINPYPGCSRALLPDGTTSPACVGCYAERIAARMSENPTQPRYHGLARYDDQRQPQWTGKLGLVPSELDKPRKWTRPRTIFVESMGDIAHESMTAAIFAHLWALLVDNARREQPHTFYLLTKRPAHLAQLLEAMRYECAADQVYWKVMAQVVAMTTTENQAAADARVPELLRCPALHFGVSAEPLVGPLDLTPYFYTAPGPTLGWVIAGGWSGPQATPSHPQWFRSLRDQAAAAGVPFQFKQWGEWGDGSNPDGREERIVLTDGASLEPTKAASEEYARKIGADEWPRRRPCLMSRVGKRAAGRLLDGVEHNGAPVVGR